ncbi:LCP family protein [Nocardioides mesophilus]|uniref:LCP family protein n=1 Tax=Nocardioides mesophilus TaxID=433659 RepID=A0A7G9RCG2_9ACTN|nr:LCP family protein [Nocardioides mesophilus]QNN53287.1 LCP family protein [Nocardioides mesophilus]
MGGARPAQRAPVRRARGLPGTLGVTLLAAVLPGAGYLWARRAKLGWSVLLTTLALGAAGAWLVGHDLRAALNLVFDPQRLKLVAGVLAAALVLWMLVVLTTYLLVRPHERSRTQTLLGSGFVLVLCLALGAPVALGARYALVQADLVGTVFEHNESATTPKDVTEQDPWGGRQRVNLLLLGGDGGVNRLGVRTDSMILVSMDPGTGRTVMFSLPRNLMHAQFPEGSPLHDLYPDGFGGEGDPGDWMLNAVYRQVPALYPGVLGTTDNEGADALKQAVEGSLGIPVDYYLLVNLQGFEQIVDAMGGVSVNINQRIPIGGNTDLGIPPDDYLEPGPDQRLDGFEALWFARGRYGSDDYQRMERQRCMIGAIIDEAQPLTLIRRYQALAEAGKRIVRSDVPSELLPAFVDLALEVKDAPVRSVVFRSSDRFSPGDPDFGWMRSVVRRALTPPRKPGPGVDDAPTPRPTAAPTPEPSPAPDPGEAVDARDTCAYAPAG